MVKYGSSSPKAIKEQRKPTAALLLALGSLYIIYVMVAAPEQVGVLHDDQDDSSAAKPNNNQALTPRAVARTEEERRLVSEQQPPKTKQPKLLDAIAYTSFPMDRVTGKIKLPEAVETVVIDIGARGSDYLKTLENTENNETALFLFDPLPDSGMPLAERVAAYTVRNKTRKWLDPTKKDRVFYTRAAVGEEEAIVDFNIASGPACGSILQTSANNTFWCADVQAKLATVVLTLADFLPLIPKDSNKISQIHLKVDAEGADLAVLRGAKNAIHMVDTVVIECKADTNEKTFRDGECVAKDAVKYMVEMGFRLYEVELQGGLVNIYWVNPKYRGPIPEFLSQPSLNFYGKFYKHLNEAWFNKQES